MMGILKRDRKEKTNRDGERGNVAPEAEME